MRTTIDLPETTLQEARSLAAARGISLKQLLAETLEEQLQDRTPAIRNDQVDPPWMEGYGALADLADENRKILKTIEIEFETIQFNELP